MSARQEVSTDAAVASVEQELESISSTGCPAVDMIG